MTSREHDALVALQKGNISGLETLVRLHQVRALRLAYSITGNRMMAEDIVCPGRRAQSLRGRAALMGWREQVG